MNGEETKPVDRVMKNFANNFFSFNLPPMMPKRASPSGTKRCPSLKWKSTI